MNEKFFPLKIAIYVGITLLVLTGACAVEEAYQVLGHVVGALNSMLENLQLGIKAIPENYSSFDLLLSQISNTFIVLSLTAVLSTDVGCVYWIDIKDHKLVEPVFSCFIAIMTYLLTGLCFSILVYLLDKPDSLIISYLISIVLLIWLSYKMISVYFGRSRMKRRLLFEYLENKWAVDLERLEKANLDFVDAYRNNLQEAYGKEDVLHKFERFYKKWSNGSKDKKKIIAQKSADVLLEYEKGIYENSIRALGENNKQIIEENIRLIAPMDRKKTVLRLLAEIDTLHPGYAAELLYSLYSTGNYRPDTEDLAIYTHSLTERLLHDKADPESILNMAKLLGSLDVSMNFIEELEYLCKESAKKQDVKVLEEKIRERIIPLYNRGLQLGCYKFIDKIQQAYLHKDKESLNYYLGLIEWIRIKLEQSINDYTMQLAEKTTGFQLMIRNVDFLNQQEAKIIKRMLSDTDLDLFLTELDRKRLSENVLSMNIYILLDENTHVAEINENISEIQNSYECLKSVLGERNPATQKTKTRLALAYRANADFVSALKLLGQEDDLSDYCYENETEAMLAKAVKAYVLILSGYFKKALLIAEEIYAKLDLSTIGIHTEADNLLLENLSSIFFTAEEYEKANAIDKRRYELFCLEDPYEEKKETLDAYFHYVTNYVAWKKHLYYNDDEQPEDFKYDFDEIFYLEYSAYEKYRNLLGEEHVQTITARLNWMSERCKNLITEEILTEYDEIYRLRKMVQGENHPQTLQVLACKCDVLSDEKIVEGAQIVELRRQIYEGHVSRLGEKNPRTIKALYFLHKENEKQGLMEGYEETLNQLTYLLTQLVDINTSSIQWIMQYVANVYHERKEYELALELYQDVYKKQTEYLGEDASDTLVTLDAISKIYADMGKKDEVIKCNMNIYQRYISVYLKKYQANCKKCNYYSAVKFRNLSALYRVKKYAVENNVSSEEGHKLIMEFYENRIDLSKPLNAESFRDCVDYGTYFFCAKKYYNAKIYIKKAYDYYCKESNKDRKEEAYLVYLLESIEDEIGGN